MYSRIRWGLWGFDGAKEKFLHFLTGNDAIATTYKLFSVRNTMFTRRAEHNFVFRNFIENFFDLFS